MEYRVLGRTGLCVSQLAFGAGPIPAVMTTGGQAEQHAIVRRALDVGINWFDTAAGYGAGQSEASLGDALHHLRSHDAVQLATKVRVAGDDFENLEMAVRRSLEGSLSRLRTNGVALLQLHNAITWRRDDEPSSVSVDDVLGENGIAYQLERLKEERLVAAIGLTGTGQADALREVIASGRFDTIQAPYNLANPSAGQSMSSDFPETNYGNVFAECARQNMGVFAIRVYAGGALAGLPPGPHTLQTRYFPLDLYRRDQARADRWRDELARHGLTLLEAALRFSLSHPAVTAAIVGFSTPQQIDEAVAYANAGAWIETLTG